MKTKYLNREIRQELKAAGIRNYEIAQYLKINPCTFQHWLMVEMPEERKKQVLKAIEEIKYAESR